MSELSKHRDSPGADAWGLAKVAANLGVNNAGGAVRDADALLGRPPGAGADDAKKRAALGQCRRLYFDMELSFAGAYDEINARDYAAGKEMAAEAMALARRCDDVFAEAGVPSPLARRGEYAGQIGSCARPSPSSSSDAFADVNESVSLTLYRACADDHGVFSSNKLRMQDRIIISAIGNVKFPKGKKNQLARL